MTIFLLAMAALVVVILLTRLSPPARWVERRSVRHYEHSMEVLRALPNRRIAEHPAAEQEALAPPDLATPPPEQPAVVDVGGKASIPVDAGEEGAKPAFVFSADDAGRDIPELNPSAPGPTLIEDPTPSRGVRVGAFVAAISSTLRRPRGRIAASLGAMAGAVSSAAARPRVRIAAGLATVLVGATVAGTLLSVTSSSDNRSQRVRQVSSVPVTQAPPATSTIPPTPSSVEEAPTTALPAQTAAQPIEPTTTTSTPPRLTSPPVVAPPPDAVTVTPPSPPPPTIIAPTPPRPPATSQAPDSTPTASPNARTTPDGSQFSSG